MKYTYTIALLLMTLLAAAQSIDRQVINTAGFQIDDFDFSINQSIGESVIGHLEGNDVILTQGFLQYFESSNSNKEFEELYGDVFAFPNPSDGVFSLQNLSSERLNGKIMDLQGRPQWQGPVNGNINVQSLAPGHYVLLVFDEQYRFKSFPIHISRP
jgi:hypothetical protein